MAAVSKPMRIHVVINARAGTVLDWQTGPLRSVIEGQFRDRGHEVTCDVASPGDLARAIARGRTGGCDALVVGGGDGTVRAAAETLVGTSTPLGILPLGTLNRLARDLKIPLTLPEAVAALASGRTVRIDVGDVNGRIFLCNSVFGPPAAFSAHRQALRGRPALERLRGYLWALEAVLRSRRRLDVTVDNGHTHVRLPVLSMAVSNNRYSERPSLLLEKEGLHHGVLAAYISRHPSGWAMARAVVRAMLGRLKSDTDVIHLEGHRIEVAARRSRVRLANDGELEVVEMPLRYTIRPRALRVLAPPDDEASQVSMSDAAVLAPR
jgi:diacylglycerol kinase family enzyme